MLAREESGESRRIVTLSATDARHAVQLLELLLAPENRQRAEAETQSSQSVCPDNLLAVARFFYLARQSRAEYFSPAMFGEPAWGVILALYLKEAEAVGPTISSLARAAGTPVSTAVRWLDYLEKRGWVERQSNSVDGRALTAMLSIEGRNRLEKYLRRLLLSMTAAWNEITGE
jgi:DNA-binding MarR family transcriptional regulator